MWILLKEESYICILFGPGKYLPVLCKYSCIFHSLTYFLTWNTYSRNSAIVVIGDIWSCKKNPDDSNNHREFYDCESILGSNISEKKAHIQHVREKKSLILWIVHFFPVKSSNFQEELLFLLYFLLTFSRNSILFHSSKAIERSTPAMLEEEILSLFRKLEPHGNSRYRVQLSIRLGGTFRNIEPKHMKTFVFPVFFYFFKLFVITIN